MGLLLLSLLASSFLGIDIVLAAPQDLVIWEIMYDVKGVDNKHEWVEVYNQSSGSVTIKTGTAGSDSWRFSDGPPPFHTFTLHPINQSVVTVTAGSYAILTDDPATFLADHPGFAGTVFKVAMSLGNDGDTLKLSANKGVSFFGDVTYVKSLGAAGNGRTLERDGALFRESYIDGGTPGKDSSSPPPPPVYSDLVVVNEVYPDPKTGEDEFVELYNISQAAVELSGWQLDDISGGGSKPYTIASGTVIPAASYLLFQNKVALNNDGDSARLVAPDGKIKSQMSYTSSTKGRSWSRQSDGIFALTRLVTPGLANQFSQPTTSRDIVINEIVPDPVGGSDDELIELRNLSQSPVDLTDWILDDTDGGASPYTVSENSIIPAGGYWIFYHSKTGLGLNNDGDRVQLKWAGGTKIGEIVYSKSIAGESYSRHDDGTFEWTPVLTPGSPNQFPLVVIELVIPPVVNPPPDSPILPSIQNQVSSIQYETQRSQSVEALPIELPPPVSPINLLKIQSSTLPQSQKEDIMAYRFSSLGGSFLILFGGVRQWYMRKKNGDHR